MDANDHGGNRWSKGPEQYLAALKRRWWLALLIAIALGGGGTAFTLWQKPVYVASSRVLIEPPRAIVSGLNEDHPNAAAATNFFNTRVQLFSSRQIAERVLATLHLSEWEELHGALDPIGQLQGWILVRPVLNSNLVDISIEGHDAELVAKIVNTTVDEFLRFEEESLQAADEKGRSRLDAELRNLEGLASASRQALGDFHKKNQNFLSTGQSVESARLGIIEQAKAEAELRVDTARRAVERFEQMRKAGIPWISDSSRDRAYQLREQLHQLDEELNLQKQIIKPERFDSDRMIMALREKKAKLVEQIQGTSAEDIQYETQRLAQELQFAEADLDHVRKLCDSQKQAVVGQQDQHGQLATLHAESQRHETYRDFLARKKLEADMLQGLTTPRFTVIDRAVVPTMPVRPIKWLQIPLFAVGGVVLGAFAVLGLEFLDKRIRGPEQLQACLSWPLLGTIPRLRRRELVAAGGRLRLSAEPWSPVAEAFRGLRAGLLARKDSPKSLVVTSAQEGEGKSTIAANLAIACARAGERVLLIDLDLRHPALDRLLEAHFSAGLLDVLQGTRRSEEAIVPTGLPNLFLLAAGEQAMAPLDILGTVEMFDLLEELTREYDRIILDAPAFLGLADARMVSQFVDGVLFVVQAGAHDRGPLLRARQLFEQEGQRPIGMVLNGARQRQDTVVSKRATKTRSQRGAPALAATGSDG